MDHKKIGLMYLFTVLVFFVVGLALALLMRFELFAPGRTLMDAGTYNRMFTAHGIVMVVLVILPAVPAALGTFILPLMLGAKGLAFPRLCGWSYYLYILGSIIIICALLVGGADTGWTLYLPYSLRTSGGVAMVVFGMLVAGVSSVLIGINSIVTIHRLRAPSLTWDKVPLFCWAMYATGIIQVLATPVLLLTLLLLFFERVFGIGIFDPKLGGDVLLFQHFFWFYAHPAVYIMILPSMGIISEIVPVFSRKPIFGRLAIIYSTFAIALVSLLVWGQHMFVSGQSELANFIFSFLSMVVAVPSGVKIFNWVATMHKGSIHFNAPFLYAMGFIALFTIGGLTGVVLATLALNVHLSDTYFVVAHFHYTLIGGALMGFVAGLHYWFPKMFGRMYSETAALFCFIMIMVGFSVTFLPMFILGAKGMPRRYWDYSAEFTLLNQMSTVGACLFGLGLLGMFTYLAYAIWRGEKAPSNPWSANSLEWQ